MVNFVKWNKAILALALFGAGAPPGVAAVLAPGESAPLSGTTILSDPSLAGTYLAETTTTFSVLGQVGANQYEGQIFAVDLRSTVIRETATGTLDFYYQIFNNNNYSVDPIDSATLGGFAQFAIDADYRTDISGLYQPSAASRDNSGDAVTFAFVSPANVFEAAEATSSLLVRTDATDFSSNGLATVDFSGIEGEGAPPVPGQGTVSTFAPVAAPEPSSLALFCVAALILCAGPRRFAERQSATC